jgi:hypothetical protein
MSRNARETGRDDQGRFCSHCGSNLEGGGMRGGYESEGSRGDRGRDEGRMGDWDRPSQGRDSWGREGSEHGGNGGNGGRGGYGEGDWGQRGGMGRYEGSYSRNEPSHHQQERSRSRGKNREE